MFSFAIAQYCPQNPSQPRNITLDNCGSNWPEQHNVDDVSGLCIFVSLYFKYLLFAMKKKIKMRTFLAQQQKTSIGFSIPWMIAFLSPMWFSTKTISLVFWETLNTTKVWISLFVCTISMKSKCFNKHLIMISQERQQER